MAPSSLTVQFVDNRSLKGREGQFICVRVRADHVLKSYRQSLYSFEWLDGDGRVKPADKLGERERDKRNAVEQKIKSREPLEKPVLGIGILDTIEIGIGRAEFLTLADMGLDVIDVHIPKSNEKDFKAFLAGVES